jgi:hypothetical protein
LGTRDRTLGTRDRTKTNKATTQHWVQEIERRQTK